MLRRPPWDVSSPLSDHCCTVQHPSFFFDHDIPPPPGIDASAAATVTAGFLSAPFVFCLVDTDTARLSEAFPLGAARCEWPLVRP